jgi:hypothetical protein
LTSINAFLKLLAPKALARVSGKAISSRPGQMKVRQALIRLRFLLTSKKWNKRLFKEMTLAFKAGKLAKDPKSFWYQGEIGFFDNYVVSASFLCEDVDWIKSNVLSPICFVLKIPLAKKLQECGVFGVSSDEYLNYAMQNRAEWAARGEELLQRMLEELEIEALDGKLLGPVASTSSSAPVCQLIFEPDDV